MRKNGPGPNWAISTGGGGPPHACRGPRARAQPGRNRRNMSHLHFYTFTFLENVSPWAAAAAAAAAKRRGAGGGAKAPADVAQLQRPFEYFTRKRPRRARYRSHTRIIPKNSIKKGFQSQLGAFPLRSDHFKVLALISFF